jgi:hypothetical protein
LEKFNVDYQTAGTLTIPAKIHRLKTNALMTKLSISKQGILNHANFTKNIFLTAIIGLLGIRYRCHNAICHKTLTKEDI